MISAQKLTRPETEDSSLELADLCEVMLFAGARRLGFDEADEMTVEAQERIMTAAATLAQGMVHYLTVQVGIARVRELIEAPGQREPELGN
jgi:hypothetical protein